MFNLESSDVGASDRDQDDHYHESLILQPAAEMADLFDNWLTAPKPSVRARAREFIEELIRYR